jgi:hypothetical protein
VGGWDLDFDVLGAAIPTDAVQLPGVCESVPVRSELAGPAYYAEERAGKIPEAAVIAGAR